MCTPKIEIPLVLAYDLFTVVKHASIFPSSQWHTHTMTGPAQWKCHYGFVWRKYLQISAAFDPGLMIHSGILRRGGLGFLGHGLDLFFWFLVLCFFCFLTCKMTDSSFKLVQIQGKRYQERKPNKFQNLTQKKQELFCTRCWPTKFNQDYVEIISIHERETTTQSFEHWSDSTMGRDKNDQWVDLGARYFQRSSRAKRKVRNEHIIII